LSALPKIPELVAEAKKYEMPALALTDSGNLYGAIQFYKQCRKNSIKPIIGVDFYVAPRSRHDTQQGIDNNWHRLILLAKNEVGYKNLIKLVTYSYLEGFFHKPRIDKELLEKYGNNLVAIVPSFGGGVAELSIEHENKALGNIADLKEVFGDGNVFLEISRHPGVEGHEKKMAALVELGKKSDTPVVAGHNIFYISPEDKIARNTLLSIQSSSESRGRVARSDDDFSFQSPEAMKEAFKELPEAMANTKKIAEMCNLEIELGKWKFPRFEIPAGSTHDEELKKLVYDGLERREMIATKDVRERIEYELQIIKDKGYAPYFLVVADLLRFARENGILSTIRGSVAGSLVTYLAGITNVDPLEYRLPFERFLNPERPSAPDIDMDFADLEQCLPAELCAMLLAL
jgi:DNA polymerase-3 subunit alpha